MGLDEQLKRDLDHLAQTLMKVAGRLGRDRMTRLLDRRALEDELE